MHSNDAAELANDLIIHVCDSIEGYSTAAENSQNPQLASAFATLAQGRRSMLEEMQGHVRSLGATPADRSSLSGAVHRGFLKLRDAIAGQDDAAVLDEVDRGEDYLKDRFLAASRSGKLDPSSQAMVDKWRQSVFDDHATIQQWRAYQR